MLHRRETVRKTRASQATSSDKLFHLRVELTQAYGLAKSLHECERKAHTKRYGPGRKASRGSPNSKFENIIGVVRQCLLRYWDFLVTGHHCDKLIVSLMKVVVEGGKKVATSFIGGQLHKFANMNQSI